MERKPNEEKGEAKAQGENKDTRGQKCCRGNQRTGCRNLRANKTGKKGNETIETESTEKDDDDGWCRVPRSVAPLVSYFFPSFRFPSGFGKGIKEKNPWDCF